MSGVEGIQAVVGFNYFNYNNYNKHTDLLTVLSSHPPVARLPQSDTLLTKSNLSISFQTYSPRSVQYTYQLSMENNPDMNQALAGLNPSVSNLLGNSIDVYV